MACKEDERLANTLAWYESNKENYRGFSQLILSKINSALEERKIFIAYSSSREKSVESLKAKCQKEVFDNCNGKSKLKYTDPKNEITDFAGVRIVTYLKSDIPKIKNIIENLFCIDYDNSYDKIELLSENEIGYLSMHYVVSLKEVPYEYSRYNGFKCEVQIKTVLQDAWSQIFHDRQYKAGLKGFVSGYELRRKTNLIAGSLELIDDQLDVLVQEYDYLNKDFLKESQFQNVLDLEISSVSLVEYCKIKFKGIVNRFYNEQATILVLNKYGFKYIRDIDNVVQDRFVDIILTTDQVTIDKLVSYILIIANCDKYFSLIGSDCFKSISKRSKSVLIGFVDIDNICAKYNIVTE